MDNLALQIIEEDVQEGFKIDNDNLAEWALKIIAEEKAETQRYINVCETWIAEYQQKAQKAQERFETKTTYLKQQLQNYFESVPHKATKTQETYKLPSGTLKLKYGTPAYEVDNEKLVKWLKDNKLTMFIKTEEKAQWGELKKQESWKYSNGKLIDENGGIVDGVMVQERPDSFEVEI
jgi:hypothetical protein